VGGADLGDDEGRAAGGIGSARSQKAVAGYRKAPFIHIHRLYRTNRLCQ
jgi:hypothetical protein